MSVVIFTDKGTFRGRKIESCVRTNFGETAIFKGDDRESEEQGLVGLIGVQENGDFKVLAEVTRIYEREPYVAPPSRSQRWQDANNKLRDAITIAEEVRDEYEEAESCEDCTEETGTCDVHDEDQLQQKLDDATDKWSEGLSELEELKDEYSEWYDNLPENLQNGSPVADKLQEISYMDLTEVSFELEDVENNISEAEGYVDEYESADLPLGFGRD